MPVEPCHVCGRSGSQPTNLLSRTDGHVLRICPPCLEANMHLQAPLGEQALTEMFFDRAAEQGLEAWQSDYVVYLLPQDLSPGAMIAK
jgi:hypothetical protein